MKPCDYDIAVWPRPAERCGQSATHVCLVEDIGNDGPQLKVERRCERHAKAGCDIIEAWTVQEWEAMEP